MEPAVGYLFEVVSRSHPDRGQGLRIFESWYPFKSNDSFFLFSLPFCQVYLYIIWHPDVLSCCSSRGGAVLFWRLRGRGGHCWCTLHVASREVFCSFVWGRTDWLAAGGLNPWLSRERRWWWRRRVEVPPSCFMGHSPAIGSLHHSVED